MGEREDFNTAQIEELKKTLQSLRGFVVEKNDDIIKEFRESNRSLRLEIKEDFKSYTEGLKEVMKENYVKKDEVSSIRDRLDLFQKISVGSAIGAILALVDKII